MTRTGPLELAHRTTGDGKPVVFVHGAAGTGHQFTMQYQAFRGAARCHFVDLPGHGGSPPLENISIGAYSEAIANFLSTLAEPAIVVGHSMGGAVALEVALNRPELLCGLVLAGTGCTLPVSEKAQVGLEKDFENTLDLILQLCFSQAVRSEMLERARTGARKIAPDVVRADFMASNAFNCCARLGEISLPTVVICGTKDVMTPAAYSSRLHASIRNSRYHEIAGGSHMVMLESAGEFNEILGSALAWFAQPQ